MIAVAVCVRLEVTRVRVADCFQDVASKASPVMQG